MPTLRPGDVTKFVGVMLDKVTKDLPLESEPAASDKLTEHDGDLKNHFLGALVMESCLPISIMWAHALFCSAEYQLPCVQSICIFHPL